MLEEAGVPEKESLLEVSPRGNSLGVSCSDNAMLAELFSDGPLMALSSCCLICCRPAQQRMGWRNET